MRHVVKGEVHGLILQICYVKLCKSVSCFLRCINFVEHVVRSLNRCIPNE